MRALTRRAGTAQAVIGRPEERPQQAREPALHVVASVQDVHGNTLLAQGLFGPEADALSALLGEDVALGLAGVVTDTPGTEGASNSAMLAMLAQAREQGVDLDHPAVRMIGRMAGRPLPDAVLQRMSAVFGHDFSHVRVHTTGMSAAAAQALNAHAFTVGSDIYFGSGEFAPGTTEGDRLLAHELTHVVQADEGRLSARSGDGLDVSRPTDPAEREAYATADSVVSELGSPSGSVDTGPNVATTPGPASSDTGVAMRDVRNQRDEEDGTGEGLNVGAALDEGLSALRAPSGLAPVQGDVAQPPALDQGGNPRQASPATLPRTRAAAPGVTGSAENITAPEITTPAGGLDVAAPAAVASEVPQIQATHGEFSGAMDTLREQLSSAVTAQEAAIAAAATAAKSAIEAAAATMREGVASAFAATRAAISAQAQSTRDNVRTELEARKAELRAASAAEKARVLDRSAAHQATITTLHTTLAADARTHGATKAEELRNQAATQKSLAIAAGAAVARRYASHARADDIRITCQRMAQEVANKIQSEIADNAGQLATDGNELATKLTTDGEHYAENIRNGDADTAALFDTALTDAEAALDGTLGETIAQVDDAETQALAQVESLEQSVLGQLEQVASAQTAGIDSASATAVTAVQDAGRRAGEALEEQVTAVEEWLATAHPSQWPLVVNELTRVREELTTKAATVVEGLGGVGTSACTQITDAGASTVADLTAIPSDLQPHLDQIVDGCAENLTSAETTYSTAMGEQVEHFKSTWATEADGKIADLDAALTEAQDGLNGTSRDGLAEIDHKVSESLTKMSELLGTLRSELVSKADEIANQSAWGRFVSGLKNLALGLWDSLVDFARTLLIVALVIIAVVIVIAVVILVVAGAEVLAAVAAAVVAFAAAIAEIVAVVCAILTVISIVFAIVNVISAWANPNLTTDEKWRATGRGAGDIALEFVPDFGISLLTHADDASDAARAVENTAEILEQADNLGDTANALENVAGAANATEELGDLGSSASRLANRAENAQDVANAAENTIHAADALPTTTPNAPTPTPRGPRNAQTNSVAEPVNLVDDSRAAHILDGDATGGGHRFGTGEPGKTEFPQHWSDEDILHHASDVVTDPRSIPDPSNSTRLVSRNGRNIRNAYYGERDGVVIKVVHEPATGRIITAHPVPLDDLPPQFQNVPGLRPMARNPAPPANPPPVTPPANSPPAITPPANSPPTNSPPTTTPPTNTPSGSGNPFIDNAPEWLQRYREAAARRAEAENIVRPELQASYELFKGFAMSTYQAVNGSGLFGDGFTQNLGTIWEGVSGWLGENEEKREQMEESTGAGGT